jgi:hypothetical protein
LKRQSPPIGRLARAAARGHNHRDLGILLMVGLEAEGAVFVISF